MLKWIGFLQPERDLCSIRFSELLNRNFHKWIQPFMETHCGDAVVSLHAYSQPARPQKSRGSRACDRPRRVKIPKLQTHLTSPHHWQQTAYVKNPRHPSRQRALTLCIQRLIPSALVLTDWTVAVPWQPEMWRVKLQLKQTVTGGALTNTRLAITDGGEESQIRREGHQILLFN